MDDKSFELFFRRSVALLFHFSRASRRSDSRELFEDRKALVQWTLKNSRDYRREYCELAREIRKDERGRLFARFNFPASPCRVNAVFVGGGAIFTAPSPSPHNPHGSRPNRVIARPFESRPFVSRRNCFSKWSGPGYNGVQRPTFESQILAWRVGCRESRSGWVRMG